ncbi:MAG: hypothetical protein AAF547_06425 [Actinomycetota bacterium]
MSDPEIDATAAQIRHTAEHPLALPVTVTIEVRPEVVAALIGLDTDRDRRAFMTNPMDHIRRLVGEWAHHQSNQLPKADMGELMTWLAVAQAHELDRLQAEAAEMAAREFDGPPPSAIVEELEDLVAPD